MTTTEDRPARFDRAMPTHRVPSTRRQRAGLWVRGRRGKLRNRFRAANARMRTRVRAWRSGVLITTGFGLLSSSAWVAFGLAAGLAAIGVSLFALDWLTRKGP